MTLAKLHERVAKLPTIMDFEDELSIAQELQKIPVDDLLMHKDILIEILDALDISHGDWGIYKVNETTQPELDNFAEWLMEMNKQVFSGCSSIMTGLAKFISDKFDD